MKKKHKEISILSGKAKANIDQFTNYQNEKMKGYKPNEKLMLNLTDNQDYVIDGEIKDWYLIKGLSLEDVTIK